MGGDPSKTAFYGSSAGAVLMAGLAIRLKQEKIQTQPAIVVLDW